MATRLSFSGLYRLRQRQAVARGCGPGPVALFDKRETLLRAKWAGAKLGSLWRYPSAWAFRRAATDFIRVWRLLGGREEHEQ